MEGGKAGDSNNDTPTPNLAGSAVDRGGWASCWLDNGTKTLCGANANDSTRFVWDLSLSLSLSFC